MKRVLALLLLCPSPALAVGEWGLADYGYEHRANGMDWDDDFVYGEATDDGKACDDADTDGATIVSEDIDGDGNSESQIYVIPATGNDDGDCGGPNNTDACATVQYVIDNRLDTGSYEDIICLVGTAHETVFLDNVDGDAGTKTRTASGDEVYDFQYPSNPNVLMGADRDQDGEYPPYDTDDTAVFDGEVGASYLEGFLWTSYGDGTTATDRWEFAHLTVQEYGTNDATREAATNRGLFMHGTTAFGPDVEDHLYYHDVYAYRINYNQEQLSFSQILYEMWGRTFNYAALENIACHECCGYIARGQTGPSTYLRVENTSLDWYCEDNPAERIDISNGTGSVKVWGDLRYHEWMHNDWDLSATPFAVDQDDAEDWHGGAYDFNTCIRDVYVVNNIVRNSRSCFATEGGLDGQCTVTPGDNLNFLRNQCIVDESAASGAFPRQLTSAVTLKLGYNSAKIFHKNVTIANNFIADLTGEGHIVSMFVVTDGVPATGPDPSEYTVAFVNNTGYSANWGETGAPTEQAIFYLAGSPDDRPHRYVIKNNVVSGGSSDDWFIRFGTGHITQEILDMDYNVFEDSGSSREFWANDGTRYETLALYSAATGDDTHSKGSDQNACDVTFVNRGSDMHLATGDTCAQEEGTSVSAYTTIDFDRDSRPQSTHWDIGADEYASGYSPKGACCGSSCSETTEATCPGLWQGAGTTCTPALCEPPVTQLGGEVAGATLSGVTKQ